MKIRGVYVDILCEIDPIYLDYMVTGGNQKVLYSTLHELYMEC